MAESLKHDSLQCTYEDARRNQLREGIALTTADKIAWFKEMADFILHFGARDQLAVREPGAPEEGAASPHCGVKR